MKKDWVSKMVKVVSIVLLCCLYLVMSGCSTNNMEVESYQGIPIYPQATLVGNAGSELVFLVDTLSLSKFKSFYKEQMPNYGWKLSLEGVNHLNYINEDREVIITYSFPDSSVKQANLDQVGLINSLNPENPPVIITLLLSEND